MMKKLILFAAVAMLAACASLGLSTSDTFMKRSAAAALTVQTVAESATIALKAGKLSKGDAENVVTTGRATLDGIRVAQTLYLSACPLLPKTEISDPKCTAPAAENKLSAMLTIMTALQSYVATQGAK